MRTIVFNHGFNRVENHCIRRIEHAKLNRLLDEECRLIEILTRRARKEIEAKPQFLINPQAIWSNILNYHLVKDIRCRLACLTDAYPQFLGQVKAVRLAIEDRFFAAFEAALVTQQSSICRYN